MSINKNSNQYTFAEASGVYADDPPTLFSRIMTKLYTLWACATYPFAATGRNLSLHYASEISRCVVTRMSLGNRVQVGKHTWLTLGMEGPHELKIIIEDNCQIGARCSITAKNNIHLDRGVILESDVLLMDHAHAYEDVTNPIKVQGPTPGGRIRIGEGCRIGRGAVILCDKGEVVLGQNCIVTPRAVVSRSFPPNSVISGNPARTVAQFNAPTVAAGPPATRRSAAELAKREE